jgi:large subunit ribosomal protein L10
MNRSEKFAFVENFTNSLNSNPFVVVMNYDKLGFDHITQFRRDLFKADASLSFVKNTLASISLSNVAEKGVAIDGLKDVLSGPVCFVLGKDPITTSKAISQLTSKIETVKVVGGFLDGKMCSMEELKMYATLPTLDVARAQIVGMLKAVPSKIARVLSMKNADGVSG